MLFGQLVDDPSAWPERFPSEEAQATERKRLFDLIEQLVKWENSTNEHVLGAARFEIARSIAWNRGEEPPAKGDAPAVLAYLQEHAPPVYDPFCGGGSIPLEAQRLGLKAYGSDLNPVAVLISKALVEIPPKFAGMPPVNPDRDPHRHWKGAQGLAEDVRYYGQWMREEAERRIGHLYPNVEVSEQAVREQPALAPLRGEKLTVIAWLWARTVASPNPAAKGAQVPLISSFMLSTKAGKKAWVEPVIDANAPDGYRFVVRSGAIAEEDEAKAKAGTIGRSTGGHCILTGAPMPFSYVREQGKMNGLGRRLMAIVAQGPRGRVYLPPTEEHEEIAAQAQPAWAPEGELPDNPRDFKTPNYGLPRFADLFTPRQLVALTAFSDLVGEAREKVLADARAAGQPNGPRLADDGESDDTGPQAGRWGAEAYADAVATYLGMGVSRLANRQATLTFWDTKGENVQQVFARQALPMTWDFCEGNPFSNSSGNFVGQLRYLANALEIATAPISPGIIKLADAASDDSFAPPWLIATDPPYYDNIGYADLSDFFYVWLRKALNPIMPQLFQTVLVPKAEELVASPYRHGGKDKAEDFFMGGMNCVIRRFNQSADGYPIPIFYAFKQSESHEDGITSKGWATFLQAIIESGLSVDGTWPVRTELPGNLKKKVNALASSVVLVCRKRPRAAAVATRAEFWAALKRELPAALKLLQQGNIAPVDMAQASIGPGMAIFTRYARVLEADDKPMTVKTALQLINQALDDYFSEQEAEYDADTRFAITWFESFGMAPGDYGTAETLATARGVAVSGVVEAGILEARGGKVRLLARAEMDPDWDPEADARLTVWECTQYLIARMENAGEPEAAALLARLGGRGEAARDLAYRLYGICERKKWADEARAYNALVVAWPELTRLAAQAHAGPAQAELGV